MGVPVAGSGGVTAGEVQDMIDAALAPVLARLTALETSVAALKVHVHELGNLRRRNPGAHRGHPVTHPTDLPPAFTPTTLPAVDQVSGVFVVLQGVTAGSGEAAVLMGGYSYLQWSSAGNAYHEAIDANSMGGGDSDLGALVVAPLDGVVTFVQWWDGHSSGFGTHLAMAIDDARAAQPCYLHVAHLNTVMVGARGSGSWPARYWGRAGRAATSHMPTSTSPCGTTRPPAAGAFGRRAGRRRRWPRHDRPAGLVLGQRRSSQ